MVRTIATVAGRDALTGLAGPDGARVRLEYWLGKEQVHVLLVSLARLDAINMTYGSNSGDVALVEAAKRIQNFAGDELDTPWFVARLSGSSFLLALRGPCSRERFTLFAQGLADAVAKPMSIGAEGMRVAPRITLLRAVAGDDVAAVVDRLVQAQASLARRGGRQIAWVDGHAARLGRSPARLEIDLLNALDNDEIEVLFQPQFGLPGSTLTGAEALARWQHPQLGRIGAGALFAIAERAEVMVPLSQAIAAKALALAARWSGEPRLSINVTAADLAVGSYSEKLAALVAASGFPAGRLTLEVTEQALLSDIELARRTLATLTEAGMRVALDDFGAGFCNFRYLKLLPLHYLKLDRSMVEGIAEEPRSLAVLRGIVAMAKSLELEVLAEGIEDEAQRRLIEAEGCASWQGFLGAEPLDAEAFAGLLQAA